MKPAPLTSLSGLLFALYSTAIDAMLYECDEPDMAASLVSVPELKVAAVPVSGASTEGTMGAALLQYTGCRMVFFTVKSDATDHAGKVLAAVLHGMLESQPFWLVLVEDVEQVKAAAEAARANAVQYFHEQLEDDDVDENEDEEGGAGAPTGGA